MVVDWTGTHPQVKGAIAHALVHEGRLLHRRALGAPPGIPNNAGVSRAIEVIRPPGTVGNGVLPRGVRSARPHRVSHDPTACSARSR